MTDNKRHVQISKAMSYLLRHGATKENLPIDENGYIKIDLVLNHNRLKTHHCTLEEIHNIVETNDKKRFHIKIINNEEYICATQGHSLQNVQPNEDVLKKIHSVNELPDKLVHGTNIANFNLILESGAIKRLKRNHVHLSPGITGHDTSVVSGMRYSSNVYIYIKRSNEIIQKLDLVKSFNGVILTSHDIPVSMFEKVQIRMPKSCDLIDQQKLLNNLEAEHVIYEML